MRPDFEPTTPKKNTLGCFVKVCAFVWACDCSLYVCIPNISPPMFWTPRFLYRNVSVYLYIHLFASMADACVFKRGSPAKQIYFLLGSFLSWQTFFIDISDSFISSACVRTFTFLPSFFYIFHFISFLLFSFLFRLSMFCLRWKQKKTTVIMAIIKKFWLYKYPFSRCFQDLFCIVGDIC